MPDEKSEALELAEAEAEVRKDYLETEYEELGVVRIYHPTFEEDGKINQYYSTQYNKLLKDNPDLPTHTQLQDTLEERGSWTEKHEERIASFKDQIREAYTEIAKLKVKKNNKNKKSIEEQQFKWQEKIFKIMSQYENLLTLKLQMFKGTVESWADDAAMNMKLCLCVKDGKDKKIWKTPEEVGTLRGREMRRLVNDAVSWWSGVSDPLFVESLGQMRGGSDIGQV